jgi:hypothetical protein
MERKSFSYWISNEGMWRTPELCEYSLEHTELGYLAFNISFPFRFLDIVYTASWNRAGIVVA